MIKKIIAKKRETIYKTKSGKSWSKKGVETETSIISFEHYQTYTSDDTIKFHNGFMGGTCRAYKGYHTEGYLVDKVVSISPNRDLKYIDTFTFLTLNEEILFEKMGYREKEVYNDLKYFTIEYHNGRKYIIFYNGNKTFMLDYKNYKIVN